jgi:hypothetical protein
MSFSYFSCVDSSPKICPVYPSEGTLSEQLDYHWCVYNSVYYATPRAKKKSLAFLEAKLDICPFQSKAICVEKIKTLMALKHASPNEGYIPSLDRLPNDTDDEALVLFDKYKARSYESLGDIRACGFGDDDLVMQTYINDVFDEISQVRQVDKLFKLSRELLNISYRIQHDPVSNALRRDTEAEVGRLILEDTPYSEIVQKRSDMLREGIGNTSIEERAGRYQGDATIAPSLPQEEYRFIP